MVGYMHNGFPMLLRDPATHTHRLCLARFFRGISIIIKGYLYIFQGIFIHISLRKYRLFPRILFIFPYESVLKSLASWYNGIIVRRIETGKVMEAHTSWNNGIVANSLANPEHICDNKVFLYRPPNSHCEQKKGLGSGVQS